jgi:hypothetical protein
MIVVWPTAAEERARALHRLIGKDVVPPAWRSHSVIVSLVFFFLTSLAIAAPAALISSFVAGVAAVVIGEMLIRIGRFAGTGIESALWIGGLFCMIFALPGPPRAEGLLLFAAACAIAGARVRNPIFGACGALFVIAYIYDKSPGAAFGAAVAIGIAAAMALPRRWQRPSTEHLFIALALVMPVAAYVAHEIKAFHSDPLLLALYAGYGITAIILGLWARHRALLIVGAIAIIIARVEAHDWLAFSEWSLMADGILLLIAGVIAHWALRGRTRGIVVTPASVTPYDEAMQIIGTVALAPPHATVHAEEPREVGEGGTFGGAGSSGTF